MLYTLQLRQDIAVDREAAFALAQQTGLRPLSAQALIMRGVDTPERVADYRAADVSGLHDPFLLADMAPAVARIEQAIENRERITLYGDYDVDGVAAITVLRSYFGTRGVEAGYYIPSRHDEGYGMNDQAIRGLAQSTDLLISVDCGITNGAQVALARQLGMDVIVTDHHECPQVLPECTAVINPKRRGDYPFDGLCGAGVAAKLVQAMGGMPALMAVVDLVALATVADIVPLTGENRLLVKLGLMQINAAPRVGIDALMRSAGIKGEVRAYHMGFQLGPRINAGGRMELAHKSAELLFAEDPARAAELAAELERDNTQRQAVCARIQKEAEEMLSGRFDASAQRCIVLYGEDWNAGVIGIVAARIAEKYHRPTLLFAPGEGAAYGSARSVPGVHIYDAMNHCDRYFIRFGGHAQAAGCAIDEAHIDGFRELLNDYLTTEYPEEAFVPRYVYDIACTPEDLDMGVAQEMELFEPCGYGNTRPVFYLPQAGLRDVQTLSDGKHLRFLLQAGRVGCIAFGQGHLAGALNAAQDAGLLFAPDVNTYAGRSSLQLKVDRVLPGVPPVEAARGADWDWAVAGQLGVGEAPEGQGMAVEELSAGEFADAMARDMADSRWGTLVLCHSFGGYEWAREGLDAGGCTGQYFAEQGGLCQARCGENAVIAAPVPGEPAQRKYRQIYLCEAPMDMDYVHSLSEWLLPGGRCIIMKDYNLTLPAAMAGLDRQAMGAIYKRFLAAVRQGVRVAAAQDYSFLACGQAAGWFAGQVFCQLGLMQTMNQPPWWREGPEKKTQLEQSVAYRRLLAAQGTQK